LAERHALSVERRGLSIVPRFPSDGRLVPLEETLEQVVKRRVDLGDRHVHRAEERVD
jgi:hypothetical protein